MAEKNFEVSMKRLEQIVEELDSGNLSLDESLKIFEEGVELSRYCSEKLTQAEKKIKALMKKQDGSFQLELVSL
ncbi:exodeoxyribonuclease VII small subunit [candidate division KSB1 bacterium]|nr:exodeoxyribonuclease VII small subunit [candidate division KSB1 bacterium]